MEVYLALLIPIIITGIFYRLKKNEFIWWEFFIPFGSVLIAIIISKLIIDYSTVQFNEFWGSTVVAVYEEEPYNYWYHKTCTEKYACGTDKDGNTKYCTRSYDCSYQEDVGPSWHAQTNIGEEINITEKLHDVLVRQFGTKKNITASKENYSPNDKCVSSKGTKFENKKVGDVSYTYKTSWNGSDDTRKAYVSMHRYENRIKASDLSVFNIKLVDDIQADSLGLFKYPEYDDNGFDYPTILGGNVSKEIQEKFKRLNGKFGKSNQLRLWILVFENKPSSIAEYQENYWVKGNKNELVICIGKKGEQIQWSHAFSWAISEILTAKVENKVINLYRYKDSLIKKNLPPAIPVNKKMQKKIKTKVIPIQQQIVGDSIVKIKSQYPVLDKETWNEYYDFLNQNLNKFERRKFKEFDYLTVEPSDGAIIFIYIFALAISIGVCVWVTNNEITDNN